MPSAAVDGGLWCDFVFFIRLAKDTHEIAQHSKSETDVVRKRREGQQREGRDHIEQKTLHLEICFGRASATYQEHKLVFRLDVDGVFVWLVAHVHELIHHRALLLRIACGYLRFCAGLFSLFLCQRVFAAASSFSFFGRRFTVRSSTFPFDVIYSFLEFY